MPRRAKPGEVYLIRLDDARAMYARSTQPPIFEFFGLVSSPDAAPSLTEILASRCLFRVYVMDRATSAGRWKRIGELPLSETEANHRYWFFKQDPISGAFTRYSEDRRTGQVFEEPIEADEAAAMERAAVWDPEHVEDRLRDHLDDRPNKWVQAMNPRSQS